MNETIHIVVEQGIDKGLKIHVPPSGARVGRSDRNDIVLNDPKLSRYHCRFFFRTGTDLCVADLGSSNQTLVNDRTVQEARLSPGDRVSLGDTVLRVVDFHAGEGSTPQSTPAVDLGLTKPPPPAAHPLLNVRRLLVVAAAAGAVAACAFLIKACAERRPPASPASSAPPEARALEISYEKVLADRDKIFRYSLELDADRNLSIRIDDTDKTHLEEHRQVDEALIRDLASFIEDAGFYSLADTYQGLHPDVLERMDLMVTHGRRSHRTQVLNRIEPDVFRAVRERIEKFGQVELGLWAVQFPPEKLLEMARDAYLLGKKLSGERQVAFGNLAAAIRSYEEADFYLRTIDPKPEFYSDMLAGLSECKDQLQQNYRNQNFAAERAMRMRQWEEAAKALRILREMIPDRSDERHREASTKLLEVEARLEAEKR